MLVSTSDLSVTRLRDVLVKFELRQEGGGKGASVLEVFDGPEDARRLDQILTEDVRALWPFDDARDYVFDLGVQSAESTRRMKWPRCQKRKTETDEEFKTRKTTEHGKARIDWSEAWDAKVESRLLGGRLLAERAPMYARTCALVTNLAVHFKWARENALAWVTTLDAAAPVAGARIAVQDCSGAVLASGVTDAQGLARFTGLPAPGAAKYCPAGDRYKDFTGIDYRDHYSAAALTGLDGGLLVTAETSGDLGFVHSSWGRGLEAWRFNLPAERSDAPVLAHTILDRALFRAGDTVHMKHVLRAQTLAGFGAVEGAARPVKAIVRHLGSSETYDLPLSWDSGGLATQDWPIPPGAKLGQYEIAMANAAGREVTAGSFRVEQFRVPLMKATVQLPAEPLVAAATAPVDLAVSYLAGGAAGELPVVLRAQVRERPVPRNAAFESFTFANGGVREGVVRERQSEEHASDGPESTAVLSTQTLTLDAAGTARAEISGLPAVQTPRELVAEIEYRDPNGEVQTTAATTPLWPAALLPGIAAEHWTGQRDGLDAKVAVLDTRGRPVAGAPVEVDAFRHRYYSHRKRLVGGFYGYEHVEETTPLGRVCAGATDAQGLFACRAAAPADGEIILQVRLRDDAGRVAAAHTSVYVDSDDPGGFAVAAADRMDVLPEKREYAPGETARLQVRMPFQRATALVTVEREGIGMQGNRAVIHGGMVDIVHRLSGALGGRYTVVHQSHNVDWF
mgnify:CR=1 FL=1